MAAQITLVHRDDFSSDQDSLALWNYAAGFSIGEDGWLPGRPVPGADRVTEAITLLTKGTSTDNLAANLQALDQYLNKADFYNDPEELYGVWLRVQMPRETGARQALVLASRRSPIPLWSFTAEDGPGAAAAYGKNLVQAYGLAIDRTPYWESDSSTHLGTYAGLSALGGIQDYGAIGGDSPARLSTITVAPNDGIVVSKLWCGFRTNRFGNRANFQSTWSLEKSVDLVNDTTGAHTNADADTKDGYKTITTFATVPTLARRCTIRVTDVTANANDQRGTYLVLLRAKLSGAGTVNVRLADGLYGYAPPFGATFAARNRVQVGATNPTSWQLYELGTVKIPSPNWTPYPLAYDLTNYAIGIDAEQIGGTPSTPALHMDCLILIPIAEGWWSSDIGAVIPLAASTIQINNKARGDSQAFYYFNHPLSVVVPRVNGGLPVGSGIMVVAGMGASSVAAVNTIDVTMDVFERWDTLRGAAT